LGQCQPTQGLDKYLPSAIENSSDSVYNHTEYIFIYILRYGIFLDVLTIVTRHGGSVTKLYDQSLILSVGRNLIPDLVYAESNPDMSQRVITEKLGIGTSWLEYCLKLLINKGFSKVQDFSRGKFSYDYLFASWGVVERVVLDGRFWLLQQTDFSKQYLRLTGSCSLFQQAALRVTSFGNAWIQMVASLIVLGKTLHLLVLGWRREASIALWAAILESICRKTRSAQSALQSESLLGLVQQRRRRRLPLGQAYSDLVRGSSVCKSTIFVLCAGLLSKAA
jgi:hypothetical protein